MKTSILIIALVVMVTAGGCNLGQVAELEQDKAEVQAEKKATQAKIAAVQKKLDEAESPLEAVMLVKEVRVLVDVVRALDAKLTKYDAKIKEKKKEDIAALEAAKVGARSIIPYPFGDLAVLALTAAGGYLKVKEKRTGKREAEERQRAEEAERLVAENYEVGVQNDAIITEIVKALEPIMAETAKTVKVRIDKLWTREAKRKIDKARGKRV